MRVAGFESCELALGEPWESKKNRSRVPAEVSGHPLLDTEGTGSRHLEQKDGVIQDMKEQMFLSHRIYMVTLNNG